MEQTTILGVTKATIVAVLVALSGGCALEIAYMPICSYDCHAGLQEEISAALISRPTEDEEN